MQIEKQLKLIRWTTHQMHFTYIFFLIQFANMVMYQNYFNIKIKYTLLKSVKSFIPVNIRIRDVSVHHELIQRNSDERSSKSNNQHPEPDVLDPLTKFANVMVQSLLLGHDVQLQYYFFLVTRFISAIVQLALGQGATGLQAVTGMTRFLAIEQAAQANSDYTGK